MNKVHGGATLPDGQFLADEPTMAAKEALAVGQKRSIAQAAADLIRAEDFIYIDAGTTTLAMVRALSGPALEAHYVTNGIAHARLLAQKGCRVFVPGGLLRPQTEAIIGAAAMAALQQLLDTHPQVLREPEEPIVRVKEQADSAIVLLARFWCANADYWNLQYDLLQQVKLTFDDKGISIPFPQMDVHVK